MILGVLMFHCCLLYLILTSGARQVIPDDGLHPTYLNLVFVKAVPQPTAVTSPLPVAQRHPRPIHPLAQHTADTPATAANLSPAPQRDLPPSPAAAPDFVAAPPAPAPLDVDQLRRIARDDESRRVRTPVERQRADQLAAESRGAVTTRAIDRAKRADCRTAYSGGPVFDPLRLIPLAIDTLSGTGCKW